MACLVCRTEERLAVPRCNLHIVVGEDESNRRVPEEVGVADSHTLLGEEGRSLEAGSSLAGVSTAEVEALRILHDGIRQLLGILPFFLDALQRER
jgi:hypothetical protein